MIILRQVQSHLSRPLKQTALRSVLNGGFGAGIWTLAPKIASQVAQLAAFILAARVLTSTEFGFYAYSSAFALLFVAIAEGGWGEFVLKSSDYRGKLSQIASVAMIAGTLITILGLVA